jgi:hypothetical protein
MSDDPVAIERVLREFIDTINHQVGVYMDALAGFEGHYTRVERQVFRGNKPGGTRVNEKGIPEVVWVSYEDPSKPDIVHNRIIRTNDYLQANAKGGSNEQQHSRAILVFLFTYWEDEIRPKLAAIRNVEVDDIKSDIMGDLRALRNAILHARGVLGYDDWKRLKKLQQMFTEAEPVSLSYDGMHKIFSLIKQDCARMLFEWKGIETPEFLKVDDIGDFTIQFIRMSSKGPSHPTSKGPLREDAK